ncbi:hypothetical protein B0H14DRAFT_3539942 [Mycena olivaceomarginata]|nr:hypothetical protein B0H14DRAFT_3539942 [Mycena olivaceomarginata]
MKDQDWWYYYVNFFVDRDMYMCYLGGGVGHYQVEILPEDDVPVPSEDEHEEDHDSDIEIPQPPSIAMPPWTSEPDAPEEPEELNRPASVLSHNSDDLGGEGSEDYEPNDGDEDEGSEDEG